MGENKNKLNFSLALALIVFCLGIFIDPAHAADIEVSASRTSGVAPLAVFFNEGGSLVDSSIADTRSTFHTYTYTWNFDDSTSGSWAASGKLKNEENGPITAHVFEAAGIYDVVLTVKDFAGTVVGTDTVQIEVADPDTYYSTTATTCVNPVGDASFVGCPTGASQVNEDSATNWPGHAGAGKRLLFKRGGSWSLSSVPSWSSNNGPVTIGAYGAGDKPHITLGTGNTTFIKLDNKSDWRIMDLHITGPGEIYGRGIRGTTPVNNILVMGNELDGWDYGLLLTNWRTDGVKKNKNIFYVENIISPGINLGAYLGAENLAIMGNDMKGGGQHTLRVYYSYVGVISHNFLSGAGHNGTVATGYGGHTLKFHGPDESQIGTFTETGISGVENRTKFNVVANNVFGGSGDYQVSVGPQSTGDDHDERLTDIIISDNRFLADYGLQNEVIQRGLIASGSYYSISNNIFDGAGTTGGYKGVSLWGNRDAPTTGHLVSDNKVYRGENLNVPHDQFGVDVSYKVTDSVVRDSYVSFPNSTGNKLAVSNNSTSVTLIDNILVDDPQFVDPDNVNPLLRDFSLISNRADVDGSSQITTTDALLTLRNSLGLSMTGTAWRASATTGDVNCDGVSSSTDALLILRYSLGLSMSGTGWCE